MQIKSPAFEHNTRIPKKYTCQGENISPPLQFSSIPEGAESLVLIMDDPDVPAQVREDQMYDHWVLFNIEPCDGIDEDASQGIPGSNTSGDNAYTGPCPPAQFEPTEHRYFFRLYALDTMLDLDEGVSKDELIEAMQDHIIEKAELIGLYEKE